MKRNYSSNTLVGLDLYFKCVVNHYVRCVRFVESPSGLGGPSKIGKRFDFVQTGWYPPLPVSWDKTRFFPNFFLVFWPFYVFGKFWLNQTSATFWDKIQTFAGFLRLPKTPMLRTLQFCTGASWKIFVARTDQKIIWLLQNIQGLEEIVSWNLTEKEKVLRSRLKSFCQIKGLSTFLSTAHKCGLGKYLKTFLLNSNINISQPLLCFEQELFISQKAILLFHLNGYINIFNNKLASSVNAIAISKIWNYQWLTHRLTHWPG